MALQLTYYYTITKNERESLYYTFQKGSTLRVEQLENNFKNTHATTAYILPIQYEVKNEALTIFYNVDGCITLEEYFYHHVLTFSSFLEFFSNLLTALQSIDQQVYDVHKFILHDEKYIFIECSTGRVQLMYIPLQELHYNEPFQKNLYELVKSLSAKMIQFPKEEIEELLNVLQQQNFTLRQLQNVVDLLKKALYPKEKTQANKLLEQMQQQLGNLASKKEQELAVSEKAQANTLLEQMQAQLKNITEKNEQEPSVAAAVSEKVQADTLLERMQAQLQSIAEIQEQVQRKTNVASDSEKMPVQSDEMKEKMNTRKKGIVLVHKNERVVIDTFPFTLGRNEQIAQYVVLDPAVSREHCQFLSIDGEKFGIVDLNSKNGTKLNGKKLNPSQLSELKTGDTVKIGECLFYVQVGFV